MKTEKKDLDLSPLLTWPFDRITLSIMLDTRREKTGGYYPAKFRVTYLGKQFYYPAFDLTEEEYASLHGEVKRRDLVDYKKQLLAGFENLKKIIQDLCARDTFSLEKLNTRLSRGIRESVFSAFDTKIHDLNRQGKVGSAMWYSCAKKSIESYQQGNLNFAEVTKNWLKGYEAHMLEEGKEYSTIGINMRALRSIVNDARREGIIKESQYPFKRESNEGYQIPEGAKRKIALNTEQIIEVFSYPLTPGNEKWRDLWIFSFYCQGANIGDILRLKYRNIKGQFIEWYRGKTIGRDKEKSTVRAFITPEMREIIDRWGDPDRKPGNYIFPHLTPGLTPADERKVIQNITHTINKKMKAIGRALGYGDITTYWARHSWASISRRQGTNLYSISKGLGHRSISTTEIYLDSIPDDELIDNANKLPRIKR